MRMLAKVWRFYADGFASMRLGKRLWAIVIVKCILLFTLLKLFFPNVLQERFHSDSQRSAYILHQLTNPK